MNGSRKLQDYLTDRKIPEPFRDRIPLLCRGEEVLWVCGVGAGNIPGWSKEEQPVRLTWDGDIPWM
jgi:tRNA(Ile)-lysidine synthase